MILAVSVAVASDPPDSKVNPRTGNIETTDSYWSGSSYDVRSTVSTGVARISTVVSTDPANDVAPRLAISPAGDTWVVWWRAGSPSQVVIRKHDYSDGSWSNEFAVSRSGEDGVEPEIVHDGIDAWVAYQGTSAGGTDIVVRSIVDAPDPIATWTVLRTTTFSGDTNVLIQFAPGHLWVTWVDSATDLGWSEYDYPSGTWSSPSFASYEDEGVEAARAEVASKVLQPQEN